MTIPNPGLWDLSYSRSQPLRVELVFRGGDGRLLDLSSHGLVAQIWQEDGSTPAAEMDIELSDPANGSVALTLSQQQCAALPHPLSWELLVIEPGGAERVWIRGAVSEAIG